MSAAQRLEGKITIITAISTGISAMIDMANTSPH